MAEEITYISYGQNEISQQDLMTNLANGLPSFMQQYKWLQKPKNQEKFLKAYDDITKNLTGATDSSGRWIINVNNIDIDGMSPKDKEIYEHAAYYIQQQMSQMTPRVKEEEKKKEDLTPFKFTTDFNKYLLRGYGNSGEIFADPEQGWDSQDVRGSNGLRGTEKRRAAMIKALQEYSDSLEDNKYNFEGTQFTDLADAKAKIQTAIDALKNTPNDESDDLPAFSALGLKYRSYFSNGGNNQYKDGLTYTQYYDKQKADADAKTKAEADAAKQKLAQQQANRYKRFRFHTGTGVSAEYLSKYQDIIGQLNSYGATEQQLTQDQKNELIGAFQIAAKNNQLEDLSKEELDRFGPGYINSPRRLKKLKGLEGFYWDSIENRVIQPFMEATSPQSFQDIINANSPEAKQKQYLNQEGAEYAELGAIVADIASIIDPEPFSAMGLSLGAAGARNYAKLQQPGKWSIGDYGSQTLDYLTSVIGAVPVVGDAVLAGKVIKHLRRLSRIGAWMDTVNTVPALKTIWDKKINGNESLTVDDWRTIGTAIRGLVSHGRMNQSNLAARKVMEQRGISVDKGEVKGIKENVNKWAQKTGFTRTQPTQKTSSTTFIKIKDENGKVVEIPITEKIKQDLETQFKGKSNAEKLKIVQENADIKAAAKGKIDLSKATGLDTAKDVRNLQGVRRFIGTNRGIFGRQTTTSTQARGTDKFENYLKNRGVWSKIKLGSNSYLRRIDNQLNINSNQTIPTSQQNKETSSKPQLALPNKQPKVSDSPVKKDVNVSPLDVKKNIENPKPNYGKKDLEEVNKSLKEIKNFRQSYGLDKENIGSITGGYGQSGATLKSGKIEVEIDGKKFIFKVSKSDLENLNKGKVSQIRGNIAKQVEQLSKKADVNETAKILKQLKAKGWLKQGGQINSLDKIIEDFINNNNI